MAFIKRTLKFIAAFFIVFSLAFIITMIYDVPSTLWQQHKEAKAQAEWDDYAFHFCEGWKQYTIKENLTREERKPLFIMSLIFDKVIQENWASSYLECCRIYNMTCFYALNYTGAVVYLNDTDVRLVNFNETKTEATFTFLDWRINENGGYDRIIR